MLIILAYLHTIKVVEVILVVTNLKPTTLRARRAKCIFEMIGASNVPVACGSEGTDRDETMHDFEFKGLPEPQGAIIDDGEATVVGKLEDLEKNQDRCNIIVGSSLRDLSGLIQGHGSLLENSVSAFYLQGNWQEDAGRHETLVPDMKTVNNTYDPDATIHVHDWLRRGNISTYTATAHSATKAALSSQVFRKAAEKGNLVAQYIYSTYLQQERKFYNDSLLPETRYMKHQDVSWYAERHASWRETHGDLLPQTFEEIEPFMGMILYDVINGLICPLQQYDFNRQIYYPHQQKILIEGRTVGPLYHWEGSLCHLRRQFRMLIQGCSLVLSKAYFIEL